MDFSQVHFELKYAGVQVDNQLPLSAPINCLGIRTWRIQMIAWFILFVLIAGPALATEDTKPTFAWTCDLPHGQSGGPVLRLDSNEVIGVMGTASDGNAVPCELNNPCLVKADGAFSPAVKDQGYAHFVHQFYTCLDSKRNISLDVPGCLLPKPKRP